MNLRPFGNTGMLVSEIGFGAWQLANPDWGIGDEEEALRMVARALETGCNFFDTAPAYNAGGSETLLGRALKPVRKDIILCSKYGYTAERGIDFSVQAIRPSLEGSLRRLQTDYVDILLVHSPHEIEMFDGRVAAQYEELEKLKQEGKIRAYGASLDWREELDRLAETTRSQAAEVMFNALYQEPLPAFQNAQDHGIGLIIKVPLDSGWLSGRYRGDAHFDDVRSRWSPEVIARRGALVEEFAALLPPGRSMIHAALQFILAHPQVSTVIPGPKTVAQTLDNFAAADAALSPETVAAIHALWERELAGSPLPW